MAEGWIDYEGQRLANKARVNRKHHSMVPITEKWQSDLLRLAKMPGAIEAMKDVLRQERMDASSEPEEPAGGK